MENELTLFVARAVALVYLPMGVGLMTGQISGKAMVKSYKDSPGLALWIGIFAVLAGTFLVQYHNIWVKGWPILVTLLGWVAVIEGVAFIAFPKALLPLSEKMSKNDKTWGFIGLLLGLLFGYLGFLA